MNKTVVIGLIIAVIVAGGVIWSMNKNDQAMVKDQKTAVAPQTDSDSMMKDQSTNYIDYSQAALATAAENTGKPVIFFKASWCPTCQAADIAFRANLDKIPAGVTILKADYDTEKDLKNKYGITYQHTFVQVDATGKELAKWNGGDIDNLISHLQ